MLDRLEREILQIIGNATSLVRTVTRKEIETGVLFPSVTAVDIKRNLPSSVQLSVIESRLQLLERGGYIFSEGGRWWLTKKGQQEVGFQGEHQIFVEKERKPVVSQIEELFAEHGETLKPVEYGTLDNIDRILLKIEELYANSHLEKEKRMKTIREMIKKHFMPSDSLRSYLEARCTELSSDIERLELELSKKKNELRMIQQTLEEYNTLQNQ
ncbi:MAG: hypothetical protein QXX08_09245 [Candidatus Bathyarchaeia archaeon]